ncbi:MAG: hypothetical protein IKW85_08865 [Muribaculaceae bacterium]|nr:hypothetical protein [Muribaculaceae bacterium]
MQSTLSPATARGWKMDCSFAHQFHVDDCYNFDRTIGLTVTYNFNVTRSRYKGSHAGQDERNRL